MIRDGKPAREIPLKKVKTLQESWCRKRRMKGRSLRQNEEEIENDRAHEGTSWSSLQCGHATSAPLGGDVMASGTAVNVAEDLNFLLSQRNYVALGPS